MTPAEIIDVDADGLAEWCERFRIARLDDSVQWRGDANADGELDLLHWQDLSGLPAWPSSDG